MRHEIFVILLLCVSVLLCGCLETTMRTPGDLDILLDTVNALAIANQASLPLNPYAIPIGVGLAGLTGVIEALRRKEKSGRKYAEGKLNGNDHS